MRSFPLGGHPVGSVAARDERMDGWVDTSTVLGSGGAPCTMDLEPRTQCWRAFITFGVFFIGLSLAPAPSRRGHELLNQRGREGGRGGRRGGQEGLFGFVE